MPDWFDQFVVRSTPAQPSAPAGGADWFDQFVAKTPEVLAQGDATPARLHPMNITEMGRTALDYGIGAAKELGAQGVRGGELLRKIPGVSALDALFTPRDVDLQPANTAQRVGGQLFNVAEAAAPGRAISKLGVAAAETAAPTLGRFMGSAAANLLPRAAVEAGAGGTLAALQGSDPRSAATISAAMPFAGAAISAAVPGLKDAAAKKVVQALGPTKERYKALAEKITPGILSRGLGGSREALQAKAAEMTQAVGEQIDDAIKLYGDQKINTQPILDAFEASKAAHVIPTTLTARELAQKPDLAARAKQIGDDLFEIGIPASPENAVAIRKISALQGVIQGLGDEARVDQLVATRRAWDKVVAQAGGYAHRAPGAIGMPLKDMTEAEIKRDGANAIRQLLNEEVPDLAAINKEYSFWKSLDDVLTQTMKRTQPQGPGLLKTAAEAAGQVVGGAAGMTHGPAGAVGGAYALGKLSKMAQSVFTSPQWRLADAKVRDQLADAIMSGKLTNLTTLFGRISANRTAAVVGQ